LPALPVAAFGVESTILPVLTRGIREFVARDWQRVRDSKNAYWRQRVARLGPLEAWRVAEELRRQALSLQAGWPDATHRAADLAAHARLAQLLSRGCPTRGR